MAWQTTMASTIVALIALFLGLQHFASADLTLFGYLGALRDPGQEQASLSDLGSTSSENATFDETNDWDIRYHLGGNGPWIRKERNGSDNDIVPPEACHVDQVHLMSRHTERYPTVLAGLTMLELHQHIVNANITLQGDMAFANNWTFFMADPEDNLENLVSTGPNAGTLEAFASGVALRTRYGHLLNEALANSQTSFWASDSRRVVETAKYFAAGFFGIDWERTSKLHVIPETADMGGNTLTPGKTCNKYVRNADNYGREYGVKKLFEWRHTYLPPIIERLTKENPNITFSEAEVYSMQELCGFEIIAKGESPWCDVLTHGEWEQFEYARDLLHFYRTGPGNPYSATMGWLWLNATAHLLQAGPKEAGPLYLSFVHDGDILPLLSALDLFPQPTPLPTSQVLQDRNWRTSPVVPMGARIIFERLSCGMQHCWNYAAFGYPNHVYCHPPSEEVFVRVIVNDAVVPIPRCQGGPGGSCALDEFMERVTKRGKVAGHFDKVCGLDESAPTQIDFLHQ